jgi:chromate transporter
MPAASLAQRSITDRVTAGLAIGAAVVLWQFKKVQEPVVVVVAALIGLAVHPFLSHA